MKLHSNVIGRAYGFLGAAYTVIYMMAMFGINNTLYSLALSAIERAVGPHLANSAFAASILPRLRRFTS